MAQELGHDEHVEPAGEPIHMPEPSFLPVLVAAGLTIALVGVVVNWYVCGFGVLLTLVVIIRWIGAVRRETAALPISHDH